MFQSTPLTRRSISANAIAHRVRNVLEQFERLRLAQQPEAPTPLPAWWDEQTDDLAWRERTPNRCTTDHDDRLCYRHWAAEEELKSLLSRFESLAGGIPHNALEGRAIQDLHNGLLVMRAILSGLQPQARLMWAVVPERHQSEIELPEVYEPEPESVFEKQMLAAIDKLAFLVATKRLAEAEGKRLVRRVSRKLRRAMSLREKRNRIAGQGKVTADRRANLERLVAEWKVITDRWEVAVWSATHALEVMEGTSQEGERETAKNTFGIALTSEPDDVYRSLQITNEVLMSIAGLWLAQRNDANREQRERLGRTLASGLPAKRKWKKRQLEKELERQAEETLELRLMLIRTTRQGSSSAHRLASAVFGARSLARRLGVKSHSQVLDCPKWREHFGEPLQLTQERRGKGLGRAIPSEAVERAASRRSEADEMVGIATMEEAQRELSRLAEEGPEGRAAAEQMRRLLDQGLVIPDHVIDVVQERFSVSDLRPAGVGRA